MQGQNGGKGQLPYPALRKASILTAVTYAISCLPLLDVELVWHQRWCESVFPERHLAHWIIADLLIEFPLVFTMYQAAAKTRGRARLFAAFQILLLSYFCQWLTWSTFKLGTPNVAIFLGLISAFVWGYLDRKNLTDNQNLEKHAIVLSLKQDELKEAHLQLVKQDEADRRILASDLHDQVLNDLKSLRQAVEDLKHSTDEEKRAAKATEIEVLIEQTTGQVREVMENLTPSVLENLGLASALDDLLRRSGSRGKLKVRFKNEAAKSLSKLSKIEELLLFRTVQEALSNIIKHAQANKVELSIAKQAGAIVVSIVDDGVGIPQEKERGQSRGLRYMRQRADLMGAHIAWLPGRENKGCQVEIKVPVEEG